MRGRDADGIRTRNAGDTFRGKRRLHSVHQATKWVDRATEVRLSRRLGAAAVLPISRTELLLWRHASRPLGGKGLLPSKLSNCVSGTSDVRTGLSVQEEMVCIARPKPRGKSICRGEEWDSGPSAQRCCSCPFASPPCRRRRCFHSVIPTTTLGGCPTGGGGGGMQSVVTL